MLPREMLQLMLLCSVGVNGFLILVVLVQGWAVSDLKDRIRDHLTRGSHV